MADIELVIRIPDEAYNNVKNGKLYGCVLINGCKVADLSDSTPLPKGHGQLVDFDELCKTYWDGNYMEIHKDDLQNIQTIIEADKAGKEQE